MRKFFIILSALAVMAFLFAGAVYSEEIAEEVAEEAAEETAKKVDHEFVGAKKCKGCHKGVHTAWLETGHAKAFTKLSAEEQKDAKCVKCHTTGTTAKDVLLENVGCEACHGAGKDYKSPKIMSKKKWAADPETHKKMALDAGLIIPVEKDCVVCHTKEGNANFKEFKFAEHVKLVHPVVEKKKTEK